MTRARSPVDKLFDYIESPRAFFHKERTIEAGNARAEERAKQEREDARERARKMSVPEGFVEVELHNDAPECIDATRLTIEGLRGGRLLGRDGRYFVPEGFVAWAAERQGYVRRVL